MALQRNKSRIVPPLRIAIDTGGTFTDCVWVENGELRALKVFSTPSDPSESIAKAVAEIAGARPILLIHGTTVGTNAVLERKGARIALVTTEGFEDSIEIGRQARPKLYDFFFEPVSPLVPSTARFGLPERTAPDGTRLRVPRPQELSLLRDRVATVAPEAIAISLLFSFANPENELAAIKILRQLGVPLSASHQILPEFREYERTSTAVMNAYLQPVLEKYLGKLRTRISGSAVFVMQSSGGIASVANASREPVRTVLSGPAGGVIGAVAVGQRLQSHNLITFDMGGTSTDVALVSGVPRPTNEGEIAGLPVRVPMLDIHTVGAGGGSIARFDAGGALRVGPESAGAVPGPICYGRGEEPTVTDANLLLGRLRAQDFLGGGFQLDLERTREFVGRWLSRQKLTASRAMTVEQFAEGVIRVVNANMEKAVRVVSIERGYDPRQFTLLAFGGAGPLHVAELADSLSIPAAIVPALPGALSAFGILVSDVVRDYSITVLRRVDRTFPKLELETVFRRMERTAEKQFRAEGWTARPSFQRTVDVRYAGQGFELNVPYSAGTIPAFHEEHKKRYGYSHPDRGLELVTVRLRAVLPSRVKYRPRNVAVTTGHSRHDTVWLGGRKLRAPIIQRDALPRNKPFKGPAIITEYSATTVVPPHWMFELREPMGDIVLSSGNQIS